MLTEACDAHYLDPIVVLAADEKFAMPLAVTVRSALENLAAGRKLHLYVLDGGISEATKDRLLRSWPLPRYHVEWLKVNAAEIAELPTSGHINLMSYYRILIPRVLPADVHRVIYLDADLVVRADLTRLWEHRQNGCLCLAAQEPGAPFLDASQALQNYRLCEQFLDATCPVPNFRELGLRPDMPYFNAGVLLIDLDAWRNVDLSGQLIACLEQNRQHIKWWDQYALNVVLAGRWGQIDPRWNQGSPVYNYPTCERSPFDHRTFRFLRDNPYIVHFTSAIKPWQARCRHPFRKEFFDYLDRTAWAGYRPPQIMKFWELWKRQERRLRKGRKWLTRQAGQLLRRSRQTLET